MRKKLRFLQFSIYALVFWLVCFNSCSKGVKPSPDLPSKPHTFTGLDVLHRNGFKLLEDKSVGLVINHTSITGNGVPILTLLNSYKSVKVQKIFTPEHGFTGNSEAGEKINDDSLAVMNIPIISLYGDHHKPEKEDLNGLDILVFDISDVGSRYYTYVSTLTLVMEAAAENGIPLIVLDRPNPINGSVVDGPILDMNYRSFVGMHPIPIRHGMTVGELAMMINGSGWLSGRLSCELSVVKLENWNRKQWISDTDLPWIPPSPNIPDDTTALTYNGFCLLEGTNISEGRGTDYPFKQFGAPWIDSESLSSDLNGLQLPGVKFLPVKFTPKSIPGKSRWPKYRDQPCEGCRITVTDREIFFPLKTAVLVMAMIREKYPHEFQFLESNFIDFLYGSDRLRLMLKNGEDVVSLIESWNVDKTEFIEFRNGFLLYE